MSEKQDVPSEQPVSEGGTSAKGATVGPLSWVVAAVALVLTVAILALIGRALLGGPAEKVEPAPASAPEATATPQTTTPAVEPGAASEALPGAQVQPDTQGGQPTAAPQQPAPQQPAPSDSDVAGTMLTPGTARDIVGRLLKAVHDGDVSAGQALVTEDFLGGVGGAEWLGAGPDALRSWRITGSVAQDGVVWVTATETWDYGSQNSRYLVIFGDGKVVVDAAEWGL